MLKERAEKLVDNTFINEFLEKGLNSDEQFYGVKYMLFYSEKSPEELLTDIKYAPVYIDDNRSLGSYFNKLLVDLILMDYSLRDNINMLKKMEVREDE
jgi:hypothetical protein|uniref:hypothetical protein n=1 Tax=[Lactobacillus] rogosae TaxID=706562 RepID=UPI00402AA392